ncbi:MAG: SPOR domain-containing protein, partial [Crocinitomicaceae bacterium]|nr:SPOR domain-containing protein [Crocinitomicaceae bacterium]
EMKEEGFEAQELDLSKGLHRISLGGTNSRKEARRLRKKAKDKGISCWILRQ